MSITKYLNLSHLRKLLSALGQRFYAIEQRQDNLQSQIEKKANVSAVLTKTNTTEYTPTATYHPATKGYVDGLIPTEVSDLNNDSGFQTQTQVESAIAQSAEVIVVNVTSTTIDGVRTYTADKTFAELKAAHDAGKILILHSSSDAVFHICYVTSATLRFSYITPVTFVLNVFDIKSDNTVERFDSVSAVRSVNNKKGNVTLTYSDVGALPDTTVIPTKVSDLNNDSGFQTQAQVENAIAQSAEVIVVNVTSTTIDGVRTYTADKTYAELKTARVEGKMVILKYQLYHFYLWVGPIFASSTVDFTFGTLECGNTYYFTISKDDVVERKDLQSVRTVNGRTGSVTLTYSDVGALPDSTVIPTKVSDLNNDAGYQTQAQVESAIAQSTEVVFATISYFNGTYTANKTYTELNSAYNAKKILSLKWGANVYYVVAHPLNQIKFSRIIGTDTNFKCDGFIVNSDDTVEKFELENVRTINGKTGAVTLTYSDVGALPDTTVIPTKVSDLNNDSGFQTQAQVESAIAQSARTMVVHITWDSTNSKYVSDKTFAEIYNAFNNDTNIIAICDSSVYDLIICYYSEYGEGLAKFCQSSIYNADSEVFVEGNCIDILVENGNLEGITTVVIYNANTFIPANVSDLNNDSGFQTQAQVNALIAAAGDDDTTYAISMSGNVITLTGSDGNTSTVTLPVYTGGVV